MKDVAAAVAPGTGHADAGHLDDAPPTGGALGLSLLALLCVGAAGGVPGGFGYVCWWALHYGLDSNGLAGALVAFSMASALLSTAIPFVFGCVLYLEFTGAYRVALPAERSAGKPRPPAIAGAFGLIPQFDQISIRTRNFMMNGIEDVAVQAGGLRDVGRVAAPTPRQGRDMDLPPSSESIARVEHFRKIVAGEAAASDSYSGIPIFAHRGLHAFAAAEMERHGLVRDGACVLDVACGAGAMSQRLGDAGMRVLGLDALPENFRALGSSIANRKADLNGAFEQAADGPVDLVVAMEIIEHLESPRAFLRSCHACLKPGGALFLTMPNVDSTYSIVSLLLKERFARFDDEYLANDGHIMPIVRHQLLAAAFDAGLRLEAEAGCGRDDLAARSWPKFWLLLAAARHLRRATPVREAAISAYVFRRPS